eukprot:Nitzschia sp. Nitz4//scaffold24_size164493//155438//157172//NITZ4_002354-RA/size164493-processed-gene-0.214-mRNA-1//1//CDS//3329544192//788//frame0
MTLPSDEKDLVVPKEQNESKNSELGESMTMILDCSSHDVEGGDFLLTPRTSPRKDVMTHACWNPRFGFQFVVALLVCGGAALLLGYTRSLHSTSELSAPTFAPQVTAPTSAPTLSDPLAYLDMDQISDSTTPLGRAFQWIHLEDGYDTDTSPTPWLQRLILAALYFGTGGETITSTWEVCGAVPTVTVSQRSGTNSRCVGQGESKFCASTTAFLECPEYYERFNVSEPEEPETRWLSWANECSWYGVHCNDEGKVVQLVVPNNGLQGPLLPELHLLTDLTTLNLGGNDLTGTLPEWNNWRDLEHLFLDNTQLSGELPETWKLWHGLESLDLSNNPSLSGALGLPGQWTGLRTVLLDNSGLDLTLRSNIADMTQLQVLRMRQTPIIGGLPTSIGSLTTLQILDLSFSDLTGLVPVELGSLTELAGVLITRIFAVQLELEGNSLSGSLPDELWGLTKLQVLSLGQNNLSGSLPEEVGNLSEMRELRIETSGLSGELPESLGELELLESVNLHFNAFTGSIPVELCSLETLLNITADCLGEEDAQVTCTCCSVCCNASEQSCEGQL